MRSRRMVLALALAALATVCAAPATTEAAKKKVPCDFKLSRNKAHHDQVKIKMTCHRKFVQNVRFKLRKKYTATAFDGFPNAICSVQSAHVVGCVFSGNGAPNGKAVFATVHLKVLVPIHDSHFANLEIFLSGGDPIGEQLGY